MNADLVPFNIEPSLVGPIELLPNRSDYHSCDGERSMP